MARHPARNWSIILQQAWSMRLRDRIKTSEFFSGTQCFIKGSSKHNHGGEVCHKFNRGKCNFGTACKYEHKCTYCFKFGHGLINCRKMQGDKEHFHNKKEVGSKQQHFNKKGAVKDN